jgi:hypothetical protein
MARTALAEAGSEANDEHNKRANAHADRQLRPRVCL